MKLAFLVAGFLAEIWQIVGRCVREIQWYGNFHIGSPLSYINIGE